MKKSKFFTSSFKRMGNELGTIIGANDRFGFPFKQLTFKQSGLQRSHDVFGFAS